MSLRRTAPALLLALALALTGCGGDGDGDGSKNPSPTSASAADKATPWADTSPAKGEELSGTGYSFKAIKGWADATESAKGVNRLVEVAASAETDESGFATNVNVVVSDAGVEQPTDEQMDQISDAIAKELGKLVPKLLVNDQTEVAGQPALDHEGAAARQGVKYYIHQYVTFKEGKAYTITFSFSRETSGKERNRVINPVMASWTWK